MKAYFRQLLPALRALLRRPRFTIPAVLTLTVGLGAAVAVFSLVKGVLLEPLALPESERIIGFWTPGSWSKAEVDFLREEAGSYESVGAFTEDQVVYRAGDEPRVVKLAVVSPDLFDVLGTSALRGRLFLPDEDQPGNDSVVVISEGFWKRELGGDPGVLGTTILLSDHPMEIVGILSGAFAFPARGTEIWTTLTNDPSSGGYSNSFYLSVLGRLSPDASISDANRELQVLVPRMAKKFNLQPGFDKLATTPFVERYLDQITGAARMPLLMLGAASLLLLLVACGNVAHLMLARSAERLRDLAIRGALGASTRDVLSLLLSEVTWLSVASGALGLLVARYALAMLSASLPEGTPRVEAIGVDPLAFFAGLAIAIATILVFGLLPAFRSARTDLRTALGAGRGQTQGPSRLRWILVAAEMAVASWLATMAVSTGRSVIELTSINPGFSTDHVVSLRPELSGTEWSDQERRVDLYDHLFASLEASPDIASAGANWRLPIADTGAYQRLEVEGQASAGSASLPSIYWRSIAGSYFESLGIPLIEGRRFDERDRGDTLPVGIVSLMTAERLWPGESAVGKRLRSSMDGDTWITVAGVVGDVRHEALAEAPGLTIYRPYSQSPGWIRSLTIVVKGRSASPSLLSTARAVIRREAPTVPIFRESSMQRILADSVARETLTGLTVAIYGAMAVALAIVGVFSLLSYTVSERRRELGIRMALGAHRGRIVRLVVREGMRPAIAGAVIGLIVSLALARWLSTFLYGIQAWDPWSHVGVLMALCLTALAACALPALAAGRLEAAAILKDE